MTLEDARRLLEVDDMRLIQGTDGRWVVYGEHPKYGYPISKTKRCATWQKAFADATGTAPF